MRVSALEVLTDHVLVPALPALWERAPGLRIELAPGFETARLLQREADIGLRLVRPRAGDLSSLKLAALELAPFVDAVARWIRETLGALRAAPA